MQRQPGAHYREGYVGLAVANMEMASRDIQGIVPAFSVQMDSDHVDTSSRQVQVKLEPFNQPAALLLLHLNVRFELSSDEPLGSWCAATTNPPSSSTASSASSAPPPSTGISRMAEPTEKIGPDQLWSVL